MAGNRREQSAPPVASNRNTDMVLRRTAVFRTTFAKLPNGAAFYVTSGASPFGPYIKTGPHSRLPSGVLPQTQPEGDAVTDASIPVAWAGKFFQNAQRAIG